MKDLNLSPNPVHLYLSIIVGATIIGGSVLTAVENFKKPYGVEQKNTGVAVGVQPTTQPQPAVKEQPKADKPSPTIADISGVTIDNTLVKGNKDAKVTIINFSDFQCPFCKRYFDGAESEIIKNYVDTGKVRYVFKPYAFLGPDSITAAEGIYCAQEQNQYWNYHTYLFTNQGQENSGWVNKENLKKLAKNIRGINATKFASCLDNDTYKNQVNKDVQEAQKIGVNGTPSTFVNGEEVPGAQPFATFQEVIERKLKE